jgi:Uma2 family endonuclease
MMAVTEEELAIVLPANLVPGPRQGQWTYADYAALPDDGRRYELMDGVLLMSPLPTPNHQFIVGRLFFYLCQYVDFAGLGRVLHAPLDVELAPETVCQPDVLVLLGKNVAKIAEKRIIGAPDLAIEVTSPGTAAYDRLTKTYTYARYGVQEYWIVDPKACSIEVFVLENHGYRSLGMFQEKEGISSRVVPDIRAIRVEQFFS